MNILVDENCLWLAKPVNLISHLRQQFLVSKVGDFGVPPKQSQDSVIANWCQQKNYAILTHDFDDYKPFKNQIIIFGLPASGVYLYRADIVAEHLLRCYDSFEGKVPNNIYVLNNYYW